MKTGEICTRGFLSAPLPTLLYMWVCSGSETSQLGAVRVRVALAAPAIGQSYDLHVRALELLIRRKGFLG
eukprot:6409293-Amphidinium_carterae.1